MIASVFALVSLGLQTPQSATPNSIAVLPFYCQGGTKTSIEAMEKVANEFLNRAQCKQLDVNAVTKAWYDDLKQPKKSLRLTPKNYYYDLPKANDLLALGKATKADFVMAYRAKFHDETVWQGVGPKTKVMVTVDVKIIDTAKEEVVLDARGVRSNGTVQQTAWRTASEILLSMDLVGLIGGGPVTPLYEKNGIASLGMAMEPWLEKRVPPKKEGG